MPNANHYNKVKYDVIIVGAGPAEISTALHLANLAPELITRTLILEKEGHLRPKLCGGGILPDAEMGKFFYGLRSALFQTFVWRQMGWFVEWAMRAFFIEWTRRQERNA